LGCANFGLQFLLEFQQVLFADELYSPEFYFTLPREILPGSLPVLDYCMVCLSFFSVLVRSIL
jgi:hypothetical protein